MLSVWHASACSDWASQSLLGQESWQTSHGYGPLAGSYLQLW